MRGVWTMGLLFYIASNVSENKSSHDEKGLAV